MRTLIAVAAALLLAGCSGGTVTSSTAPGTSSSATGGQPSPDQRFETAPPLPDQTGTPTPLPDDHLAAIRADLSARGISADGLTVISARAVVWNDGSWGCPQPGSFSTQALEQGMAVIVEVDGVQYDYRFGSGPTPRLCVPLAQR
ncbi:MAG: hypothetical protein WAZ15_00160 [Propioniciclava sp.]|jgi:hypothetical protein